MEQLHQANHGSSQEAPSCFQHKEIKEGFRIPALVLDSDMESSSFFNFKKSTNIM